MLFAALRAQLWLTTGLKLADGKLQNRLVQIERKWA